MKDQVLRGNQTLTETWTFTFTRGPGQYEHWRPHVCRTDFVTSGTAVSASGIGASMEEARLDLIVKLAFYYASLEELDPAVSDETLDNAIKYMRREQSRRRRVKKLETA